MGNKPYDQDNDNRTTLCEVQVTWMEVRDGHWHLMTFIRVQDSYGLLLDEKCPREIVN